MKSRRDMSPLQRNRRTKMRTILLAVAFVILSALSANAIECGINQIDDCDKTCPTGTRATSCKGGGFLGLTSKECDCKNIATTPPTGKKLCECKACTGSSTEGCVGGAESRWCETLSWSVGNTESCDNLLISTDAANCCSGTIKER